MQILERALQTVPQRVSRTKRKGEASEICICSSVILLLDRWTDVKQEYDEYVEQSREMEAEMDATLEQKQSLIKDLRAKLNMLEKENDSLKVSKHMQ